MANGLSKRRTPLDAVAEPTLPDVLEPKLNIVFCAPNEGSGRTRHYYAKPGNRFWPTLFDIGLTTDRLGPTDYLKLPQQGLGLIELARFAGYADQDLPHCFDRESLLKKIERYQPRVLAFTSKHAGECFLGHRLDYGPQVATIGSTVLYVLPSPSGSASRYWDISHWQRLAQLVKRDGDDENPSEKRLSRGNTGRRRV